MLTTPADTLLLARAEAGWGNHRAVRILLEGAPWLDAVEGGVGWRLLARALEEEGEAAGAAEAYARYRTTTAARSDPLAAAWGAREARLRFAADEDMEALAAALGPLMPEEEVRAFVRDAVVAARLEAGDTARAVTALEGGPRDPASSLLLARLLLARGDTSAAVTRLGGAADGGPTPVAGRAAALLLRLTDPELASTLRLARKANRAGLGGAALRGYDRAVRLARAEGAALPDADLLARAVLMGTVPSRRNEAIRVFRELYSRTDDPAFGPRVLEAWMRVRKRQGMDRHVAVLERWLVERFPASPQAAKVLWDRAYSLEARGARTRALQAYQRLVGAAPTRAEAGRARMRMGQIHLARGAPDAAAEVFEAYLREFPEGRRWEEAAFWAGYARLELSDTAAARAWVDRIREASPFSYYAVLGGELMGRPFAIALPGGPPPREPPGWLSEGLERLDLLAAAGLDEAAATQEARLIRRAGESVEDRLALAEALIERGRTISGINLGWELRREGIAWNRRLLQVVFPFPYREMVVREAREWGVDPILLAALIRQESAFKADIVSPAGAVGLMQVMAATGRQLARAHGPYRFVRKHLTSPELNLHLGAAFLVEMERRYGGDLPLMLAAYNAGPTRASRWRRFEEAADPLRFTERIPFAETRGYVKNIRRNLEVYRALYGGVAGEG
ncbi:MAG: transglycosylase SLT domain-containing protein [Gemmatimonadota bacterium]